MSLSTILGAVGAAVGGYFGGPSGAQFGYLAGSTVGALVEGSQQHTEGPRLADLKVTGSSYGEMIPYCIGAPRVSGQVWWSSDKREIETTTEVGKGGGPTVSSYTYEQDLIIGLHDGLADALCRVWSNGKLIWTDLSTATDQQRIESNGTGNWRRITFYRGTDDQLPDPVYEAAVGADEACAYRGRAYVMIEGLQLGNSGVMPNLQFEVSTQATAANTIVRRVAIEDCGIDFGGTLPAPAIVAMVPNVRVALVDSIDRSVRQFSFEGAFLGDSVRTDAETFPAPEGVNSANERSYPAGVLGGMPVRVGGLGVPFGTPYSAWILANCFLPESWNLLGFELAVPLAPGRYLGGFAPCSDGAHAVVFTSPSNPTGGAAVIDAWHIIRFESNHAVLVREGGVETSATITQFGLGCVATYHYGAGCLEDDLTHVWTAYGAGTGNVRMYRIGTDDVLRKQAEIENGLLDHAFRKPAVWAQAGFFFVVSAASWHAFVRSGVAPEVVPVADAIEALLRRAGMQPDQYDLSALESSSFGVRAMALAQVGDTRGAIEQVRITCHVDAAVTDRLRFAPRATAVSASIPFGDLGAGEDAAEEQPLPLTHGSDLEAPAAYALTYLNVDADHQSATELSDRLLSGQASTASIQVAIGMRPAEAKAVVDGIAQAALAELTTSAIALPLSYAALQSGDAVQIEDEDGVWHRMRLGRREDTGSRLKFDVRGDDAEALQSAGLTDESYGAATQVRALAATVLAVLDIPLLRDADDGPGVYVAARSAGGDWPGCAVMLSADGVQYSTAATIAEQGVLGVTVSTLGPWSGGWVMDEVNAVDVQVGDGVLESITRDVLLADAAKNAIAIGAEVIRYATATLLSAGPNVYRLSRLLRGQLGTEWATASHVSAEAAVALAARGMRRIALQAGDAGRSYLVKGVTTGASATAAGSQTLAFANLGQVPLAPVDIRLGRTASDDLLISWRRRTRLAARFCGPGGIYVPLGEKTEQYRVDILSAGIVVRSLEAAEQQVTYTRAQAQADHGTIPETLIMRVRQISAAMGDGREASAQLPVPASIAGSASTPGGPLPGPPEPPALNKAPTNIVCATASGVLAMRIEAGVPVYYVSSGATMVPLGIASTAFAAKGNYHDNTTVVHAGTVWFVFTILSAAYAVTVPADYSAAPSGYGYGAFGVLPDPGGATMPVVMGSNGTTVVAWNSTNKVFASTTMPTFSYVAAAAPDASVGWSAPYQYFPSFVGGLAKLLPTAAGWLLAGSTSIGGLYVYRTADPNGQANWLNCSAVSNIPGQSYETISASAFFDALTSGSRVYVSGRLDWGSFLAISTDSGATWNKYGTQRRYAHLMALGSAMVAISEDGQWVAINDGSSLLWAEYRTVGLGAVPHLSVMRPHAGFFVDTTYGWDQEVIVYTADGIHWSPVS